MINQVAFDTRQWLGCRLIPRISVQILSPDGVTFGVERGLSCGEHLPMLDETQEGQFGIVNRLLVVDSASKRSLTFDNIE